MAQFGSEQHMLFPGDGGAAQVLHVCTWASAAYLDAILTGLSTGTPLTAGANACCSPNGSGHSIQESVPLHQQLAQHCDGNVWSPPMPG
jgi:hypothetical protein